MPIAAHRCTLYYAGGSFGAANDAAALISGTTYYVNTVRGKNAVFSPKASVVVKDGGVSVGAAFSANYLAGQVTLNSAPAGAVTVDYNYMIVNPAAEVKEFSLNLTRDELDDTIMGDTDKNFIMGLKGGTGTIGGFSLLTNLFVPNVGQEQSIESTHNNDTMYVLEVVLNPTTLRSFRCFAKIPNLDLSGARDGLVESSFGFTISEVIAPSDSTGKASYSFFNRVA